MRPRGREYEKNKNKKGIKNNKETRFKWSCKKIRSFDIKCIIKWDVKCYKVVFLICQMLKFLKPLMWMLLVQVVAIFYIVTTTDPWTSPYSSKRFSAEMFAKICNFYCSLHAVSPSNNLFEFWMS